MNRIKFVLILLLAGCFFPGVAQRYFTKAGDIRLDASGKIEMIKAVNKGVTCVIDTQTGALQLQLLMKSFQFEKALMEEHFNENYVESDKFPKSDFKGEVVNNAEITYAKDGQYPAAVNGKLTIHGVTKDIQTKGLIVVNGGKIEVQCDFVILLSDYNIEIPNLVKDNISTTAKIKVSCSLEKLKS